MIINHTGTTLTFETQEELEILQIIFNISYELANDSIKEEQIPSIFKRCGVDNFSQVQAIARMSEQTFLFLVSLEQKEKV